MAAALMVVTVILLLMFIQPTSLPALMVIGAVGAASYALAYLSLLAASAERRIVLDLAASLVAPLRR